MARFKTYPVFFSLIAALGLVAAGSGWCVYERSIAAKKSAQVLAKKRSELSALLASQPAPSPENATAVKADLTRSEAALARMRSELKGSGHAAEKLLDSKLAYAHAATLKGGERTKALRDAKLPSEPTHLFFNIATFVQKMRVSAQKAQVKIKPDEQFGFATYASAGPDRDLIPQVYRQRQVAEYLLDALIDSQPSELVSLQRESPLGKDEKTAAPKLSESTAQATNAPATNNDLFEIDSRITARVPGFVAASAFRLTFIGDTESLRRLLNKLATFELPLVVRSVEVDPLVKAATVEVATPANTLSSIFGTTTASAPAPVKPKPLVEKVLSKFTVTIELIDLVENTPTEATPTH